MRIKVSSFVAPCYLVLFTDDHQSEEMKMLNIHSFY